MTDLALSISEIESRLLSLADSMELAGVNAGGYVRLRVVESIAHELAHVVDLGPDFEAKIRGMGDAAANGREAAALRIEVAALSALGVTLSMRRLRGTANWRGGVGVPSLSRLRSPLSQRERRLADQLVSMVISTSRAESERR